MSRSTPSTNQIQQYRNRQNKLGKLLNSHASGLCISPVQTIMISLIFIGIVFVLHILAKFVPASSLPQAAVALLIVLLSVGFSFLSSK